MARDPHWQPVERLTSRALPAHVRPWLTDDGSLTARLAGLGRGRFSVERLYQGWQVPRLTEQRLLGLPQRQQALVREVVLLVGGEPLVFARSVFPVASLEGRLGHLRRLQNSSLGAILFRHPSMQRSPFELARVAGDSPYLPSNLQQKSPAWGRRSRFDIASKSLLVSEVFLQAFSPWSTVLPVHRSQRGRVSTAITRPTQ